MNVLCVDPGINGCGVAVFDIGDGVLLYAGYVAADGKNKKLPAAQRAALVARAASAVANGAVSGTVSHLALEWPQVYREAKLKGDPNDLLPLAGVDSALCALIPTASVTNYRPRDWKGTISPDVLIERIKQLLTPDESARVVRRGALDHNTWDAVGIGLFYLGRMGKKNRVIHR